VAQCRRWMSLIRRQEFWVGMERTPSPPSFFGRQTCSQDTRHLAPLILSAKMENLWILRIPSPAPQLAPRRMTGYIDSDPRCSHE
jgi:hypothetical protein